MAPSHTMPNHHNFVSHIPLPVPKNHVLLAMMEAAQRHGQAVNDNDKDDDEDDDQQAPKGDVQDSLVLDKKLSDIGEEDVTLASEEKKEEKNNPALSDTSTCSAQVGVGGVDDDNDEEGQFDRANILSGMSLLTGPCGTYGVRAEQLVVLPRHPDCAERTVSVDESSNNEKVDDDNNEPFVLRRGQTVQVVDFAHGLATLARHRGYILATNAQLVKIGGPRDISCRYEGLLETIANRGRDLESTLQENKTVEARLQARIAKLATKEPSHPIITACNNTTTHASDDSVDGKCSSATHPLTPMPGDSHDAGDIAASSTPNVHRRRRRLGSIRRDNDKFDIPLIPSNDSILEFDENGVAVYEITGTGTAQQHDDDDDDDDGPALPSSPNSIDNADLGPGMPGYRRANSDEVDQFGFGCGSAFLDATSIAAGRTASHLFGESSRNALLDADARPRSESNVSGTTSNSSNSNSQQYQARLYQHMNYYDHGATASTATSASLTNTSSFDTSINWRTGMSGHRALLSSKSRAGTSEPLPRGEIRMMSEHRGIARIKKSAKTTTTTTGMPLPVLGTSNSGGGGPPAQQQHRQSPSFGPRFLQQQASSQQPYFSGSSFSFGSGWHE